MQPTRLPAEYVLPVRWANDAGRDELTAYLTELSRLLDVTVVDGSPPELFRAHAEQWAPLVRHLAPEPWPGPNGKVAGVMTGVRHARHDRVILADDDVRHDAAGLADIVSLLDDAEVVRPQNYFPELPWHARWDTARTLVNRALDADYPGTLGVRRSALLDAGGYAGDVLFENLELLRTIRAAGGREVRAGNLFVARAPASSRHFLGQRVRQAYDDFAQPARLVSELALLPLLGAALSRPPLAVGVLAAVCMLAETGRRRDQGRSVFPWSCTLWAPVWLLERAVCVWVAVALRIFGGVPYAGGRLTRAASSRAELQQRLADRHPVARPVRAWQLVPA